MGRRLAALFCLALASCEEDACRWDTDCAAGEWCEDGSCLALEPVAVPPECFSDEQCALGEVCEGQLCVGVSWGRSCPELSLAEELRCRDWDPDQCPCYAGVVAFHERDEGGPSCGGITSGTWVSYVAQHGCHLEALDGAFTAEALGFDGLTLRLATQPEDATCTARASRWQQVPGGPDRAAVQLECSETCTLWMEQLPRPPPEAMVPDGTFELGSAPEDAPPDRPDEAPAHLVDVTCFSMDAFEVSRDHYLACVDVGGCTEPAYPDDAPDRATFFARDDLHLPVTHVTQAQARAYCRSRGMELPTEAEWERAARSSRSRSGRYPWGDEAPSCRRANVAGCAGRPLTVDDLGGGESLRADGRSWFGIADLAGNVREWTRDHYAPTAYADRAARAGETGVRNPEQRNPDPALGAVRVVRGGSFRTDAAADPDGNDARVRARDALAEEETADDLGFRCVRYKPGVAR